MQLVNELNKDKEENTEKVANLEPLESETIILPVKHDLQEIDTPIPSRNEFEDAFNESVPFSFSCMLDQFLNTFQEFFHFHLKHIPT